LQGVNRLVSPSSQRKEVSPGNIAPFSKPVLPIDPIPEISPAKPVLFARQSREKNAPRIRAALFCRKEDEFYPLFALENGELQLWDVQGDELHLFPARRTLFRPSLTTCAAFATVSGTVATGHESGQVRLQWLEQPNGNAAWKSHTLGTLEAHLGCVLSLAVAKTRLYSAGSDGTVVLTNLSDDRQAEIPPNRKSTVVLDGLSALSCLAVSLDGRLLALGADDGQVQMWHLAEDGVQAHLDWTSRKDLSPVKSLMFAPNGNMLLSRNAQGQGCLWAAQTGHRLPFIAQPDTFISPAFASDSRLLAHTNTSQEISLFDSWTGALQHTLPPVLGEVQAVSFSPARKTQAREALLIVVTSQQIHAWKVMF
jgi:WD40 repeat protein